MKIPFTGFKYPTNSSFDHENEKHCRCRSRQPTGASATLQHIDREHLDEELPPGAVIRGRDVVLDSSRLPFVPVFRPQSSDTALGHDEEDFYDNDNDSMTAWSLSDMERRNDGGTSIYSSNTMNNVEVFQKANAREAEASIHMSTVSSSDWTLSHAQGPQPVTVDLLSSNAAAPRSDNGSTRFMPEESTWALSVKDDEPTTYAPGSALRTFPHPPPHLYLVH